MNKKRGQVGIEYVTIMGFVVFILVTTISISYLYSSSVSDRIKTNQQVNCVNKIISATESIYYAGYPSKATINCYFPDNLNNLSIVDDSFQVESHISTGLIKNSFASNVPINGSINYAPGLRSIIITAYNDKVEISTA